MKGEKWISEPPYVGCYKFLSAPRRLLQISRVGRRKRKLTKAEKAARRRRREDYMIIFINGKQKRVKRPPTIDGVPVDEFIRQNADPIWLHQNELWEYMADPNEASDEPF